jgi:hypothetical protein
MARTQKINVVIEVELTESDQIIPDDCTTTTQSAAEIQADQEHEQALLDALRADPTRYTAFIKTIVVGSMEEILVNRLLPQLSQLGHPYTAGLKVLKELVPGLPGPAQAHFQQGLHDQWFSDGTMSVFNAVQAVPVHLTVEYPVKRT